MPNTAAKPKKSSAAAPSPTLITVTGGVPSPHDADAPAGGRVQFLNNDNQGYLIQIPKSKSNILQFLPALSSITVAVDPNAVSGSETDYTLLLTPAPSAQPAAAAATANAIPKSTAAGGGKIIINQ
jgi:hypothetical protein